MYILIADDHALFRDSLRSLLEAHGLTVVGEAKNGREAVELARKLKPDLILMDLAMPEMDGLAATRLISAEMPEIKVVVLTASDEDSKLFEAIKSGAQGYLLKNLESEEFFALLDGIDRGEPGLTPALARKLLQEFARPATAQTPAHRATRRSRPRAVVTASLAPDLSAAGSTTCMPNSAPIRRTFSRCARPTSLSLWRKPIRRRP